MFLLPSAKIAAGLGYLSGRVTQACMLVVVSDRVTVVSTNFTAGHSSTRRQLSHCLYVYVL